MHSLIEKWANYCIEQQIIDEAQEEWFVYGVEKRLSTIIVSVPFFTLALAASNIQCAVSFFITFFILRKYIGGFHAGSVLGCLIVSLLSEVIIFFVVYPFLFKTTVCCTAIASIIFIYILAPYNHPNMHLSNEEMIACKKIGRARAVIVTAIIISTAILGIDEISKGSTMGIALTAVMLCLGHIFDRRISK